MTVLTLLEAFVEAGAIAVHTGAPPKRIFNDAARTEDGKLIVAAKYYGGNNAARAKINLNQNVHCGDLVHVVVKHINDHGDVMGEPSTFDWKVKDVIRDLHMTTLNLEIVAEDPTPVIAETQTPTLVELAVQLRDTIMTRDGANARLVAIRAQIRTAVDESED